jgi:hypothetical protein
VQLLPGLCPTVTCLNPFKFIRLYIKLFAAQEHRVTFKEKFLRGKYRSNDPGTIYPIFLPTQVKVGVPFFAKDKKIKIFGPTL